MLGWGRERAFGNTIGAGNHRRQVPPSQLLLLPKMGTSISGTSQSSSISISHQLSLIAVTVSNARCRRNLSLGDCRQAKIPRRECCKFFPLPLLTQCPTISLPLTRRDAAARSRAVHTGQCPGPLYGRDMAR